MLRFFAGRVDLCKVVKAPLFHAAGGNEVRLTYKTVEILQLSSASPYN